jgi:hypothetical protein
VVALVGALRTYAVFLNDADADGVRDETDNCPTVPNTSQLDTDNDQIGDACECVGASCSDGNACTDDGCDPTTGCTFVPNADPCSDGNACTTGDACGGGACQPGTPLVCNDGNACTDDGCDPTTGCVYANNTSACEDGNPCTVGDACSGGTCQSGTGITPPTEADGLAASADEVTFTWAATPGATSYDVVRGALDALAVGPGGGDELCFGGLFDASVIDYQTPPSGEGFWYVARGRNACGAGTYGEQSNGTPRDTTTCP